MVRAPFYDKNGLKKGAWSREEDERLRAYIQRHGHSNWRQLPKFAGLARCGKSCRLRWLNYLRPDLKHGNYTREEEEIIIKLHQQLGNKWSLIAEKLPGRTDNEVKNYWHSHLKKYCLKKSNELKHTNSKPGDNLERNRTNHHDQFVRPDQSPGSDDLHHTILESSVVPNMSTETSSSEGDNVNNYSPPSSLARSTMNCPRIINEDSGVAPSPWVTFEEFGGDFWTEPFVVEDYTYTTHDEICSREGIALLIPNFLYDGTYFV